MTEEMMGRPHREQGLDVGAPAQEGISAGQVADDLEQTPEEKQNRTDGATGEDSGS